MKVLILLLLFSAIGAKADLVIQQKNEIINSQAHSIDNSTIQVKGDKIRIDHSDRLGRVATSLIKDESTGEIIFLKHETKTAIKQQQKTANLNLPPLLGIPEPQDTGKSELVGNYTSEIYTWTNSRGTVAEKLWVAKDFPDYEKIKNDLPALEKINNTGNIRAIEPDLTKLSGMVVKLEKISHFKFPQNNLPYDATNTVTLISAKEKSVDATIFEVPNDYKVISK